MKKVSSLLLALILCLSLCACGGGNETNEATEARNQSQQNNLNFDRGDESEKNETEYPEPIVLLDNEDIKIVAKSKFAGNETFYGMEMPLMGYEISVENKTDKYVNIMVVNVSVDGYMLGLQETPIPETMDIAPGKKANTRIIFITEQIASVELKELEDLINVEGQWQITFSGDGQSYSTADSYVVGFENILP